VKTTREREPESLDWQVGETADPVTGRKEMGTARLAQIWVEPREFLFALVPGWTGVFYLDDGRSTKDESFFLAFVFRHPSFIKEVEMAEKQQERYEDSDLYRIRHSAAHVMAQAVVEMFPEAKYTIGPPVEDGFYYDFDLPRPLSTEDLEKIEKRMRQIIAGHHPFIRNEVSADEARGIFRDQPYKLELIEGLEHGAMDEHGNPLTEKPVISTYTDDTFVDLCRGPHVENTGQINPSAVKLMNVAGAYWRGDEKRPMLQRIYGTAWRSPNTSCPSPVRSRRRSSRRSVFTRRSAPRLSAACRFPIR
jgi:Ser-tRNA(Ala) deacylase AlaX